MALKRYVTEMGMGTDVHGGDYTKAAKRAVSDAIRHSSLNFFRVLNKSPKCKPSEKVREHFEGAPKCKRARKLKDPPIKPLPTLQIPSKLPCLLVSKFAWLPGKSRANRRSRSEHTCACEVTADHCTSRTR